MIIALNGSTGYIGSALVKHLEKQGHHVVPCTNRLDDVPYLPFELVTQDQFDVFIHLAGIVGDEAFEADPEKAVKANVHGLANVLKVCTGKVKRFIYVSSGSVYGSCPYDVVNEGVECKPITRYAAAKLVCEGMVKAWSNVHCIEYVIARPGSVCGVSPNMKWESVVNRMTYDALTEGVITVNSGDQYRAVVSMDYLCQVLQVLCCNPYVANQVYNASEDSKPIWYLARLVQDSVALSDYPEPQIVTIPDNRDYRSYRMNSDKMQANVFSGSLITYINHMCAWHKENK